MKIKVRYIVLIIVLLLLLVVFLDYLLGFPRVFSINRDFDLNSGDERMYVYVCFLKIKDDIQVTPFSQEIRRLGIAVPKERKWMPTNTKVFMILHKKYIYYAYGGVPADCNFLIWLFDYGNVTDENRRMILQKFITVLQIGDHRNVPHMIEEELQVETEKILKVEK
jgi:hypothetical protein